MEITSDDFGVTKDGQKVTRYTLSNKNGMSVRIIDFGGTITEINIPDSKGKLGDVVLGYDNMKDYEEKEFYLGALIGRVASRIANGAYTLDGKEYKLYQNNGPNTNHGGKVGFHKKIWQASVKDNKLVLKYVSADGEENHPGELTVTVVYSLDDDNALHMDYTATSTKATPLNLTNHAYFNLGGHDWGQIGDHMVTIDADAFLPINDNIIPTGEICPVDGTERDFRKPVLLGDVLHKVPGGRGFDTMYCLGKDGEMKRAARVEHPMTGRFVECHTTEPGMNFYTGFYLEKMAGKQGAMIDSFGGFCLEAQHYPNSINQPNFPNTVLRPGETYKQNSVYKFGLI